MTQKARRKLSLDGNWLYFRSFLYNVHTFDLFSHQDSKQKVPAKKRLETSKKSSKENEAGEEIVGEEAALLHENQTDNSVSKRKRDDEEDDNLPDEEENSDDDFQQYVSLMEWSSLS